MGFRPGVLANFTATVTENRITATTQQLNFYYDVGSDRRDRWLLGKTLAEGRSLIYSRLPKLSLSPQIAN